METTRTGPRGAGTGAPQQRGAEPRTRARGAGWAALAAGLSAAMRSGSAGHGQAPPLDRAALRRAVDGIPAREVTGAVVRVAGADGHWWGSTGTGDLETGERARADGLFRADGVSALFTGTLVLRRAGEGLLALEAPVRDHLPDLLPGGPDGYDAVTVGMLLDHTSGLPGPHSSVFRSPEEAVTAALRDGGRAFAPGEYQQENDVNTWVAALVVERATGRPLAQELRERITRPLGLYRTRLVRAAVPQTGARPGDAGFPETATGEGGECAGGMVSTAADLDRFLDALLGGRLLGPAQQRLLFELPGPDVITLPRAGATGGGGGTGPGAPAADPAPAVDPVATDPVATTGPVPHRISRGGLTRVVLADGPPSGTPSGTPDGTANGAAVWGRTGAGPGYVNGLFGTRDRTRRLACSLIRSAPPVRDGERHVDDLIRAAFTAGRPAGR
ncbi:MULTISPECIES: serine hydrolase domain-containing protein [Streptomyces]|uniref:serine hydrolase domain-containing protein n=1 Tax=Streptomyces TaxID=1883 RepID=UPI00163BAD8D|nr:MULTISPECIES: serine hydrolase domain-containing protein [Streptomyces]MBC2874797.1 beta-lactamase family protein [Streptomyces sp. TYQ1024]UBI37252.1 beta-lactamase family protein [Streptomyces mobaraensis]UKW29843.1 beta-lactamase family protein [Streptomyces sp. TYQ1024]